MASISFSTAYAGAGASLSSTYYMRNFYSANRDAFNNRSSLEQGELSMADGIALRRAVRRLGSFQYDDTDDTNIRNSVLAYIETYNNTLSSLSDATDDSLERYKSQLEALTKEYSDSLDDIGITVNSDGTLTSRESLFKSASISKFESLFSNDSKYMQRASSYAKRIRSRSEEVYAGEKRLAASRAKKAASRSGTGSADAEDAAEGTGVAALAAEQSVDLDTILLNAGIGANVNVSL